MREQHTEEEEFTEKMQKIQQIGKEVKRGDFNFFTSCSYCLCGIKLIK